MPKPFKLKPGEVPTDAQRLVPDIQKTEAVEAFMAFIRGLEYFKDDKGNPVFEKYGGDDELPSGFVPSYLDGPYLDRELDAARRRDEDG